MQVKLFLSSERFHLTESSDTQSLKEASPPLIYKGPHGETHFHERLSTDFLDDICC